MQSLSFLLIAAGMLGLIQCSQPQPSTQTAQTAPATPVANRATPAELANYRRATFAGGCFWCEEAIFERLQGVAEVVSGYAGGTTKNPTYEQVGTGTTGHAESFEIYYDSTAITFPQLLDLYFASIDPLQVNGQGPDHGSQYRSIIFYRNASEKQLAEDYIARLNGSGQYNRPLAVEVVPFTIFYPAEDYHQNYVEQHPENPYVQHESIPRMKRTLAKVPDLVKSKN